MENLKCTYCGENLIITKNCTSYLRCPISIAHCFASEDMSIFHIIHEDILYKLSTFKVQITYLSKYTYIKPEVRESVHLIEIPKYFPIDINSNLNQQIIDIIVRLKQLILFK
jgi:hypothetical protein